MESSDSKDEEFPNKSLTGGECLRYSDLLITSTSIKSLQTVSIKSCKLRPSKPEVNNTMRFFAENVSSAVIENVSMVTASLTAVTRTCQTTYDYVYEVM